MASGLVCPGCRKELDVIASAGRPDDLYLCPSCYYSWFRFELGDDDPPRLAAAHDREAEYGGDPGDEGGPDDGPVGL